MPTAQIPTERLDNLAKEAVVKVFDSMVGEELRFLRSSCLLGGAGADLIRALPISAGFYGVVVSFIGDVNGKVMLILPVAAAQSFTKKLFDVPSLDWLEENPEDTLVDTLGELGNMLVGLIKGGLTKWYPTLVLTTPKVLKDKRLKVETKRQAFRTQYIFEGFDSQIMIDFCCE